MLEPAAGLVIAGRYRLQSKMGSGGMGSVWLADHMALGSPVAVKLLHADLATGTLMTRFTAEAKAAASLRSPHVVQILDHGVDGDTPFIVMERLEGESLGDRLLRRPGPDYEETLTILTHTMRAMTRAHEAGIVHRDLKPDNIFLHNNDDEFVAKVLDFGIAKVQPEFLTELSPNTHTGMLIGSPYYMSPEQAEGRRDLDWRSDLWAIGIIAYECLTGVLPYNEETLGRILVKLIKEEPQRPSTVAPVPQGFDEWFAKANHKDRKLRFQSAKDMLDAFRDLRGAPLVYESAGQGFAATVPGTTPSRFTQSDRIPAPSTMGGTASAVAPREGTSKPLLLAWIGALSLLGAVGWWMASPARNAPEEEAQLAAPVESEIPSQVAPAPPTAQEQPPEPAAEKISPAVKPEAPPSPTPPPNASASVSAPKAPVRPTSSPKTDVGAAAVTPPRPAAPATQPPAPRPAPQTPPHPYNPLDGRF